MFKNKKYLYTNIGGAIGLIVGLLIWFLKNSLYPALTMIFGFAFGSVIDSIKNKK